MMTKVLEAIIALLKFNPHGCTLSEVGKIAEQKPKDVLAEINRNRDFLEVNKSGKIIKLTTSEYIQKSLDDAYHNYELYTLTKVYNHHSAPSCIDFKDSYINYPQLYEVYSWGLYEKYRVIIANEENLKFVKSLGKQDRAERYAKLAVEPIEYFWRG